MSQQLAERAQVVAAPPMRRWVRWILVAICVLIAAMWVYALGFAPKKAVYRLDDEAWRSFAERRCSDAREERQALADTAAGYIAEPTPEQMRARADIVDRATDIVESMVGDIVAHPVASQRDRDILARFDQQYRTLIADRRAYTAELRSGVNEPYHETRVAGGPVTNVIVDFTTVNEIRSCTPPGELGGDA